MRIQVPTKLHSSLSLLSILALAGLIVFAAAIVLVANPFGASVSSGIGGPSGINALSTNPRTAGSTPTQQGSGTGAGQGSLLTGPPSTQGSHLGDSGEHHHHNDGGNSTADA